MNFSRFIKLIDPLENFDGPRTVRAATEAAENAAVEVLSHVPEKALVHLSRARAEFFAALRTLAEAEQLRGERVFGFALSVRASRTSGKQRG